jgi:hypothetical protein
VEGGGAGSRKWQASYFSMKSVVVNGCTVDQAVSSILIALYMSLRERKVFISISGSAVN